jgi:hypothetical protein
MGQLKTFCFGIESPPLKVIYRLLPGKRCFILSTNLFTLRRTVYYTQV